MKFFSSSVIPFISQGLLRNQNKQTRTHNNPIKPLTKKVVRHPNAMARGTTMNGATAAPAIWPTREAEIPLERVSISYAVFCLKKKTRRRLREGKQKDWLAQLTRQL